MTIEKIETEVPGLDILTKGGIPKGRSTLIAGRAGCGKSVLALQIACNMAKRGLKVVVLAIGANNIDRTDNAESTLRGIEAVTRAITARLPDAKIVVAGVFPRRREFENNRVKLINTTLAGWDNQANLRVLDVTANFAANPVREDLFRPNDIHLNERGYRLWTNLMLPLVDGLRAS